VASGASDYHKLIRVPGPRAAASYGSGSVNSLAGSRFQRSRDGE
jgi:hypothetical protein